MAEKRKYKEDWKGEKKLSRVAGPKSTCMGSQLPPEILKLKKNQSPIPLSILVIGPDLPPVLLPFRHSLERTRENLCISRFSDHQIFPTS